MNTDSLTLFSQQNLICLLTFDTDNCLLVRNAITPELFDGIYKKIVVKLINYIDKYKVPPQEHIADELESYLADPEDGPKYQEVITSIYSFKVNYNAKYIIDNLIAFVKNRNFTNALYDAAALHQKGRTTEAQELMRKSDEVNLTLFDPGIRVTDLHLLARSLEEDDIFPTGILALDDMGVGPGRKQILMYLALKSTGKAQPLTAKILTPVGWTQMGNTFIGQQIIDSSGQKQTIEAIHPQGYKQIYKITFSDNTSTRCCSDHLWEVNTKARYYTNKPNMVKTTKELLEQGLYYNMKDRKWAKFFIPYIETQVEFDDQINDLPIEPYALGILLGDGGFTGSEITITSDDPEIFTSLAAAFPDLILSDRDSLTKAIVSRLGRGRHKNYLIDKLRQLNLFGRDSANKFIPEIYKFSSIENRHKILQGLFDTDGSPTKVGAIDYISKSERLVLDIQEIVFSLGGRCTVTPCTKFCTYKGQKREGIYYRAYITLPTAIEPVFGLARKQEIQAQEALNRVGNEFKKSIIAIESDGVENAQCITVSSPNGLYVTDDYILTHNTWFTIQCARMAMLLNYKVAHISLEISKEQILQRYVQNLCGITRWQYNALKSPMFVRNGNNEVIRVDQAIIDPRCLEEADILEHVRDKLNKFGPKLENNIRIKDFPPGKLDMAGLRAYLDGLERTENFIPDEIIVDMPRNMKLDINNFRLSMDQLIIDLRGLAVERNAGVIAPHQINRKGAGAKFITGEHISEDWGILGTADTGIIYNQKVMEQKNKIARLYVDRGKSVRSMFTVLLAQNYDVGQYVLDSARLPDSYDPDLDTMTTLEE